MGIGDQDVAGRSEVLEEGVELAQRGPNRHCECG